MNDFLNFIKFEQDKKTVKEICLILMKDNNIDYRIVDPKEFYHYKYITNSASIENGRLVILNNPDWIMVLHELCHLLVVEPEYRIWMDIDTNRSYRKINMKYPENKSLRTESCTIGLQDLILSKFNLGCNLVGTFFQGRVGLHSDVNQEWIDRAYKLYQSYQNSLNGIKSVNSNIISMSNEQPLDNDEVFVLTNQDKIFRCSYNKGNFKNLKTNSPIPNSSVSLWSRI